MGGMAMRCPAWAALPAAGTAGPSLLQQQAAALATTSSSGSAPSDAPGGRWGLYAAGAAAATIAAAWSLPVGRANARVAAEPKPDAKAAAGTAK
jgi:hypothetical protein